MSFDALTWACRQDPGEPIAKLVLIGLARHASANGLSWPSVNQLADYSGLDRKAVLRRLAKLERAGMIEDSRQRRGDTGRVKVWRLALDQPNFNLPKSSRRADHLNGLKQSRTKGPLDQGNGPAPAMITGGGQLAPKQSSNAAGLSGNGPAPVMIPVEARNGPRRGTRNKSEVKGLEKRNRFAADIEAVQAAWNDMAKANGLAVALAMTEDRKTQLRARLKEHGLEPILGAIASIPKSPFLMGKGPDGWKANFDFMLRPARLNKLIEGAYLGMIGTRTGQEPPKLYQILNAKGQGNDG